MRALATSLFLILGLAVFARPSLATETCGDGIDNDSNSKTDEGCDPSDVTGVCESPVDCAVLGRVSPNLGALVFPETADLQPRSPYGPSLTFQRTYMSAYSPSYFPSGVSDYTHPLGYRYHHNYMSWIKKIDSTHFVLHTTTGHDVYLVYSTQDASYNYYTAQRGYHFYSVKQKRASAYTWEVRFLTGEVHVFDWNGDLSTGTLGKITTIEDNYSSPRSLAVTYNADGQVDKVTDASAYRWLQFTYFGAGTTKTLQKVELYSNPSTPTSNVTLQFAYDATTSRHMTSATLAASTILTNTWDTTAHFVTARDGRDAANYVYNSGKVVDIQVGAGNVGYTYGDSGCNSGNGVYVYYNRQTTGTCETDGDCGTNMFCGGKDANGFGWCYAVRECMAYSTTSGEPLLSSLSATAGGVSCASCVNHKSFTWDTTILRPTAVEAADSSTNLYTTYVYDSNGMATTYVEGDTDTNPSNSVPTSGRVHFYTYGNSNYPGKVTEIRIKSELDASASSCSVSVTTGCRRTLLTYSSEGLLTSREEIGTTLNASASNASYDYTTSMSYDASGRLTAITGPVSGEETDYTYWPTSNGLSTGYLYETKRKKDATPTYITSTSNDYDYWGNSKRLTDPNTKSTCRTFDSQFGLLASSRTVVNGSHTDCGSSGGNDKTTSYAYTYRRQTVETRPLLNCIYHNFDSMGRLTSEIHSDYVSGTCSNSSVYAHSKYFYYDNDGVFYMTEWKDGSSGSAIVVRRTEYTIQADRRIATKKNPVQTSYAQSFFYYADGVLSDLRYEDYATKGSETQVDVDSLNRPTTMRRYKDSDHVLNDTWTIVPGVQLDLPTTVTDDAGHPIALVWDDLGRKVKVNTPDGNATVLNYDADDNLVTLVRGYPSADAKTTQFTYDALGRLTAEDTAATNCTGGTNAHGAEYLYTYDALPAGISCPSGSNCSNLAGRLAYVKALLYCDAAKTDSGFDQATFDSYTEEGLVAEHTVQDDAATPRVGRVAYTYDKNNNVTREDYPAGSTSGAVYTIGGGSAVPDADMVTDVKRDTTTILSSILWMPFGPLQRFVTQNGFVHSSTVYPINSYWNYDLMGRLTSIYDKTTYLTPDNVFKIDYATDPRGRYTKRDFTYGTSNQKDMFFLYDALDRVTCRTTTSQTSCSSDTTGTPHEGIAYNTSGDRSSIVLANLSLARQTYTTTYFSDGSGSIYDKIDHITKSGGGSIAFTWNGRGERTSDDDSSYTTDARTYSYDERGELVGVTGKFYNTGSGTYNNYTMANAYDEQHRRIFKSFKNTTVLPNVEAQWYFYYDQQGRLIQAKYTPNISASSTYSTFQWYWLGTIPILYYQVDNGGSTTRRYLYTDEQGRPHVAWDWPSGTTTTSRVWEVEAGLFGWDIPTVGGTVYQPLRFPGQYYDKESEAWATIASTPTGIRPGLSDNRYRVYDSSTGMYVQVDPLVASTWEGYAYAGSNPMSFSDRLGLNCFEEIAAARTGLAFGDLICAMTHCHDPYQNIADAQNYADGATFGTGSGSGFNQGATTECGDLLFFKNNCDSRLDAFWSLCHDAANCEQCVQNQVYWLENACISCASLQAMGTCLGISADIATDVCKDPPDFSGSGWESCKKL